MSLICLFVSEFADLTVGNCLSRWRSGLESWLMGNGWLIGSVVNVSIRVARNLSIGSLSEFG